MSSASEKITNDPNTPNNGQTSDENPNPASPPWREALVGGHECEFGCTFCEKKFSNKQALGGHQNAHKYERSVEKAVKENPARYFGNLSAQPRPCPPFPVGPYVRPGPLIYSPVPVQGYNRVYPGWTGPAHGIPPQFIGPPMYMQYARPVVWNPQAVMGSRMVVPGVSFGPVPVHPQEQVVDHVPDVDTTLRL